MNWLFINKTEVNLKFFVDSTHVAVVYLVCFIYLFHQLVGKQVFNKLSQVLPYHSLMEEGHPAVHQPDDGGSAVSSQLVGQATLITQVHNANANTLCNSKIDCYCTQWSKTQVLLQ